MTLSLVDHRLIITVNRRLARDLVARYSAEQIKAGKSIWESPEILPWSSWLQQLWRSQLNHDDAQRLLLSPVQSRMLWENIVRYSPHTEGLLQISETSRMAMAAWRLLHDQDLCFETVKPLLADQGIDTQAFADWASSYEQRLQRKNWLDPDQLEGVLIERFESAPQDLPDKLLLAGFNEFTPRQQRFLEILNKKGCSIQHSIATQENAQTKHVSTLACQDAEAEIHLVAAQIHYQLEQNPQQKIAVAVPNLQLQKSTIESIFSQTLCGTHLPTANTRPFNISLGDPLSSFALINTAFTILTLTRQRLPLEDLSRLIRSPFIVAAETEINQRSLLDARLRSFADDSLGLNLLIREASGTTNPPDQADAKPGKQQLSHCPQLVLALTQLRDQLEQVDMNKKRSMVEWLKLFDTLLSSFGWPGQRPCSSEEFQTLEAWRVLREQSVSLDTISQEMGYSAALSQLRKIASETTFQAESPDVPVQIMGLLETSGLRFDHLFVIGMTDAVWPAKAAPNPFLPLSLQRAEKMPHASAEVELNFARRITEQLLNSAPWVQFSYAQQEADQRLYMSPMIRTFREVSEADLEFNLVPDYSQQMFASAELDPINDTQAQALPQPINWSGGASLFKDQAACPFRAFVKHRLRAEPLGIAEAGLNPAERGSLLHAALENLWIKLRSQARLKQLSDDQRSAIIRTAVAQALEDLHSSKAVVQTDTFLQLETQRLERLIDEWLQLEVTRSMPFEVVACEKKVLCHLGGLQINTRIDRIDQLDNGQQVLIDYKSSSISTQSWQGDRPDEPQLPLYASHIEIPLGAVLFANLKKGEQTFIGLSDQLDLGKNCDDWPQQLEDWRQALSQLAHQFVQGDARVDPKDENSCRYCHYESLCRISEVRSQRQEPAASTPSSDNRSTGT